MQSTPPIGGQAPSSTGLQHGLDHGLDTGLDPGLDHGLNQPKPPRGDAQSPLGIPGSVLDVAPHATDRIRRLFFGRPRDPSDRSLFHRLSLVAFLAWVGLGADGLSSAAYGPAEAFLALQKHTYLALALAVITPMTVIIISAAYSRIIEAFPQGGGGYVVATKLLGPSAGVVSGCALLVDYVLTITVSIAAAGDAIFSLMPPEWHAYKLSVEVALIVVGITLNIRGVKESILPLVPIFMLFLITHAVLIAAGVFANLESIGPTAHQWSSDFKTDVSQIGLWALLLMTVRAYSLGAGTYTGIEAVSNGLSMMREPRVQTGKRTMTYMSISLAITAAGLLIGFLLMHVEHDPYKTLNAVLTEKVASNWGITGNVFVLVTLIAEAAILAVAAQTGFLGGPRVLANMALDGWVPRRFASLSDRLTTQNGIVLMGAAAMAALLLTNGHVSMLVLMYSINVFITFSLSMGAMLRMAWQARRTPKRNDLTGQRRPPIMLFAIGLALCSTILVVTSIEKFTHGGWVTLTVTGGFVTVCFMIRRHYRDVSKRIEKLQEDLRIPDKAHAPKPPPFDPTKPTAAVLVGGYSGLGIHTMLGALTAFGGYFKNVVFVSVAVIDTGTYKGQAELEKLEENTKKSLEQYVDLANRLGVPAVYRYAIGIDPVDELEKLCLTVQKEFGRAAFFAGQLTFRQERWFDRILHNQTAFTLQRRLHWAGIPILILPIRVR